MEDFPSNSQRRQTSRKEEPKAERPKKEIMKVVEGDIVQRKRPLGKRLRETFLGSGDRSIFEFILEDVIIPNIRDMVFEAGQQGLERSLYGESQPFRRGAAHRPGDPRGRVNYNGVSRGTPRRGRDEDREVSRRSRANHDFGELIIETRPEAEAVLEGLFAVLDEYEVATVADLYELVGATSQFTDRRWGWVDLRGSDIRRVREGWLLDLPRPTVVE